MPTTHFSANTASRYTALALASSPSVKLFFKTDPTPPTLGRNLVFSHLVCAEHGRTKDFSVARTAKYWCPLCRSAGNIRSTVAGKMSVRKGLRNLQLTLDARHAAGKGDKVTVIPIPGVSKECVLSCESHGEWKDRLTRVRDNMSFTCPKCALESVTARGLDYGYEEFVKRWKGRKATSLRFLPGQEYSGSYERLKARCITHNETVSFTPNGFSENRAYCTECVRERKANRHDALDINIVNRRLSDKEAGVRCTCWRGTTKENKWSCIRGKGHPKFTTTGANYLYSNTLECPRCCDGPGSKVQDDLFAFVKSMCPDAVAEVSFKQLGIPGDGRRRVDIYVPSLKKVIELDGVYWHSAVEASSTKHRDRLAALNGQGYTMFAVTDLDWIERRTAVEGALAGFLNAPAKTLYARKMALLTKAPAAGVKEFCADFHLQGAPQSTRYAAALAEGRTPVAVMVLAAVSSVRGSTAEDGVLELVRYAVRPGYRVVGGAERLFKALLKSSGASTILSYSHNKWFSGAVYGKLGFEKVAEVAPDYQTLWLNVHGIYGLKSKQFSRRSNLARVLGEDFDPGLSESANLEKAGVRKLFDYGKKKWIFSAVAATVRSRQDPLLNHFSATGTPFKDTSCS